jgi:uncharacterized protein (TIGR02466 family)
MKFESYRLFPTLFGITDNTIHKRIVSISKKYLKKHGSQAFFCPCTSTIKNNNQILEEKEFVEIKNIILETIQKYCEVWGFNEKKLFISESWLNYYSEHDYQDLHHHHNSAFSGVIYLQSDGEHDFVLQAPWVINQPIILEINNKESADTAMYYMFPSTPGRCYIFPSYLLHRTLPAKSDRISLSFNCDYRNV